MPSNLVNMKNKYTIQIFWSEEDAGFIAICRDFPGLSAFGESREEAFDNARDVSESLRAARAKVSPQ